MNEPDATLEPSRTADLHDVGDGHSIQVRRNPAGFRLMEFFRERSNAIRLMAVTVATTLLVMFVGSAAWRIYADWRLGRIELTNDGPPLTAQVLPDSGDEPIGEPFDVVTRGRNWPCPTAITGSASRRRDSSAGPIASRSTEAKPSLTRSRSMRAACWVVRKSSWLRWARKSRGLSPCRSRSQPWLWS